MRYYHAPKVFSTRHWAYLWKANIPNHQSLKDHASSSTIFVAIDAEPWRLQGLEFSEIGITILVPLNGKANSLPRPTSLEALVENFTLRSYSFKVAGRDRAPTRPVEDFWGGQPTTIDAVDVEDAIVQALENIPSTLFPTPSSQKPKLCLIGFAVAFEFRILFTLYPRILQLFSSWVDLQELVRERADPNSSECPSMRMTLVAFGFQSPVVRGHKIGHSAGNDTMRMVAILLNLLTYNSVLLIQTEDPRCKREFGHCLHRRCMQDPRFFDKRPKPWESYPFAAQVVLDGHAGPVFSVLRLYKAFIDTYDLVAVGAGDHNRTKPPYERGWVCLASLAELNRFVAEVNGQPCRTGIWEGIWEVISYHDASLTPATTAEELTEWLKIQAAVKEDEMLLVRKQKREREVVDPLDILAGDWTLDEENCPPEHDLSVPQDPDTDLTVCESSIS